MKLLWEYMEFLIDFGATADLEDNAGLTILDKAEVKNWEVIVNHLTKLGCARGKKVIELGKFIFSIVFISMQSFIKFINIFNKASRHKN